MIHNHIDMRPTSQRLSSYPITVRDCAAAERLFRRLALDRRQRAHSHDDRRAGARARRIKQRNPALRCRRRRPLTRARERLPGVRRCRTARVRARTRAPVHFVTSSWRSRSTRGHDAANDDGGARPPRPPLARVARCCRRTARSAGHFPRSSRHCRRHRVAERFEADGEASLPLRRRPERAKHGRSDRAALRVPVRRVNVLFLHTPAQWETPCYSGQLAKRCAISPGRLRRARRVHGAQAARGRDDRRPRRQDAQAAHPR